MKYLKMLVLVPAAVVAAACGSDNSRSDDALKNDLALASQAQPFNQQQVTSPTEMGYAYNPYTGQFQPVPAAQPPVVQRVSTRPATATRRRAPARTSAASSGSRVIYEEPAQIQRNTKRDAVIGAAAGAVIGATVSRDRLKGAVIGAAAGGVLGGIIGHTVDVKRP